MTPQPIPFCLRAACHAGCRSFRSSSPGEGRLGSSSLVCGTLNKASERASSGSCVDTSLHVSRAQPLGRVLLARSVLAEAPAPWCRAAAPLGPQQPGRGALSLRRHQHLVASRRAEFTVAPVRVSPNSYDAAPLLTCSPAACPRRRNACSRLLPIFEWIVRFSG